MPVGSSEGETDEGYRASPARGSGGRMLALYVTLGAIGAGSVLATNLGALAPSVAALLSFCGVISAALLISWGAEAAQFYVSQGLAIASIALLQVLPEFMIEATIAWHKDIPLMFANATGSNRILIGLGWTLVFFTADVSSRLRGRGPLEAVVIPREHVLEVMALLVSSSYYLVLLFKRNLALYDTFILGGIFLAYLELLRRMPKQDAEEKEELLAPPRALVELSTPLRRGAAVLAIFTLGGCVMAFVADPFVEAMKQVAARFDISAFFFVQWIAPLLSEFPEKVTAFYWARSVRLAPMALLNLISSTVSQYTALVAMIPAVYAAACGDISATVPMDAAHRGEVLLSFAMTLYGCACLLKLRYTRENAITLFSIWVIQFVWRHRLPLELPLVGDDPRRILSALLIFLAAVEITRHRREIHLIEMLRHTGRLLNGGRS